MIELFFIALRSISISHHLQIAFSLLSPRLDTCYSAATPDARGTFFFAEEHVGFWSALGQINKEIFLHYGDESDHSRVL